MTRIRIDLDKKEEKITGFEWDSGYLEKPEPGPWWVGSTGVSLPMTASSLRHLREAINQAEKMGLLDE